MTDELPEPIASTVARTDATTPSDGGFSVTTTVFEADVAVDGSQYTVTVRTPTLEGATADAVGSTVREEWFRTLERRLGDAPKATRSNVDLDRFAVRREDGTVSVEYSFEWSRPERAVEIAKTFVEYVEGTYVESVIPGYEYEPPVADLLADASQTGDGGTPL